MLDEAMDKAEQEVNEWNERKAQKITHKGFSEDSIVQKYVQYAYEL